MTSRRDVLKGGMFLAGASGLNAAFPAAVQRAYAIAPDPGTTYLDAEHVVVLMQENRSFDHMFGTLQGVRGFNDPRALRQGDGASVFLQRDRSGAAFAPWRLSVEESRISWMGALPHGRTDQIDAWNGGAHNNWIEAKRHGAADYANIPLTMGYCTRADMPFYYALADAFTVCDQNYCSIMTSTAPNRLMLWTGTVREEHDKGSLVYMRNEQTHPGGLSWTTYGERLQQAGVSWKCYQNEIWCETPLYNQPADAWLGNDGDNPLERFARYPTAFSPGYLQYTNGVVDKALANVARRTEALELEPAGSAPGSPAATALKLKLMAYADQKARLERKRKSAPDLLTGLTSAQRELRARGLATNRSDPDYLSLEKISFEIDGATEEMMVPKGDVLHQFRDDVRSGQLPTVSWLVAPTNYSLHPGAPWFGAWYVSEIMNILTENPEVWKKTIFILTFDENDGFFDHAPSFVAADPERPETGGASRGIDTGREYSYDEDELIQGVPEGRTRSGPIGLGYRVPMLVASPWSRGGWVNSQVSDHTSVIRLLETFLEGKFGKTVLEPNISDWRRTVCGDLTSVFRAYDGDPAPLPVLQRNEHLQAVAATRRMPPPGGYQTFSATEVADLTTDPNRLRSMLWQEAGSRPACALPYELYADGELDRVGGRFRLRLKVGRELFKGRAAGAPFNVYLYGVERGGEAQAPGRASSDRMAASTYVVRAGDKMRVDIDLARFVSGQYDIAVHGPNGFYRHFTGDATDPEVEVQCRYSARAARAGGRLEVSLANRSYRPCDVIVEDLSYGAAPITVKLSPRGEAVTSLDLSGSADWYDFRFLVQDGAAFARRYAGHVEAGSHSTTDPAMARGGSTGSTA